MRLLLLIFKNHENMEELYMKIKKIEKEENMYGKILSDNLNMVPVEEKMQTI